MDQRSDDADATAGARYRAAASDPRPPAAVIWFQAVRPKTLLLSITPVAAGTGLALLAEGAASLAVVALAIAAATAIQIGTNLWNDACDGVNGTDTAKRLGPPRVTAAGLLPAVAVKRAALFSFLVAVLGGLGLVAIGGWPIVLVGVSSLVCGLLYSAGPRPIAATPFGEVFVFVFFGLVAVAGTYYLHTGAVSPEALLFGSVVGLPASAVLLVNNHRDRAGDAANGRRTLAILAGVETTRLLYGAFLLLALTGAAVLARPACAMAVLAFLPVAAATLALAWDMQHQPISWRLNATLARTAALQALLVVTVVSARWACAAT